MSWAVFHAGGWTVDLVAAGTVLLLSLLVIYGAKEGSMFNIGEYQLFILLCAAGDIASCCHCCWSSMTPKRAACSTLATALYTAALWG